MTTTRRRLLLITGLLALTIGAATLLVPWLSLTTTALHAALAAKGIRNVRFTVAAIGFDGIQLRDVAVGDATPLLLPELTVGFTLHDLWQGKLQNLRLDGVVLSATRQNGQWQMAGMDKPSPAGQSVGIGLPVTGAQIAAVPVAQASLSHSTLQLAAPDWTLALPIELNWNQLPAPRLTAQSAHPTAKFGAATATAANLATEITFNQTPEQWRGTWQLEDLTWQGLAMDVPTLKGTGTLTINADAITIDGNFVDITKAWGVFFRFDINSGIPTQARLTITRGSMPWNGGTLALQDVVVPMNGKSAIQAPLQVKGIAIDTVMQQLTGKRATAQGVVSGTLPVTIKPDGTISIDQGKLQAEAPGVIAIDPAVIPGDNDQVALMRDVLRNLHYTLLALSIDNGKNNKPAVTLTVEGKNPEVQNGRAVKLQVHLGGDVLEFMQQGLMSFTDPKQLLRQDAHEKK